MHEPSKFCPACGQQNNLSAQFCQRCGLWRGEARPAPVAESPLKFVARLATAFCLLVALGLIYAAFQTNKPAPSVGAALTPSPMAPPVPNAWIHLTVVKSDWEKGGFGSIAMWKVTFKNNSDRPIGNIQYRTAYFSETGNQVDKGGVDSILGKKVVQKVIPPKSTRTIEINDGFVHSEAHRASFQLVDCQFVADSR